MLNSTTYRVLSDHFLIFSLMVWTLMGFSYLYDNTMQYGCLVDDELFSFHNMVLFGISIILLSLGYFERHLQIRQIYLLGELVFWIYKLFIIKGGYVVGLTGETPESIVIYDSIALLLRLMLIRQVFAFPMATFLIFILTSVVIYLKIQFFR